MDVYVSIFAFTLKSTFILCPAFLLFTLSTETDPMNTSILVKILVPLLAFAYSQEFPSLANTGQDQLLVSSAYNDDTDFDKNVLSWLSAPNPLTSDEVLNLIPDDVTEIFSPTFMQNLNVSQAFLCYSMLVKSKQTTLVL